MADSGTGDPPMAGLITVPTDVHRRPATMHGQVQAWPQLTNQYSIIDVNSSLGREDQGFPLILRSVT